MQIILEHQCFCWEDLDAAELAMEELCKAMRASDLYSEGERDEPLGRFEDLLARLAFGRRPEVGPEWEVHVLRCAIVIVRNALLLCKQVASPDDQLRIAELDPYEDRDVVIGIIKDLLS